MSIYKIFVFSSSYYATKHFKAFAYAILFNKFSLVHPREVFKEAIKQSANSIILVHNHPSGNVEPSDEDYRVNNVLIETGNLIGIKVLDHLIVGDGKWESMEELC